MKVPGFPLARGEVQPTNPVRSHPLSTEGLSLLLGNLESLSAFYISSLIPYRVTKTMALRSSTIV